MAEPVRCDLFAASTDPSDSRRNLKEMPDLYDDDENDGDAETSEDESEDDTRVLPVRSKHAREPGSGTDNPAPRKKTDARSTTTHRANVNGDSSTPKPDQLAPGGVPVTKQTIANARSIMTREELNVLLYARKLPKSTSSESHPQTVARLAQADNLLTNAELDALLDEAQEKRSGNKADKIARLQKHDAETSAAGMRGVKASDEAFKAPHEGYAR